MNLRPYLNKMILLKIVSHLIKVMIYLHKLIINKNQNKNKSNKVNKFNLSKQEFQNYLISI